MWTTQPWFTLLLNLLTDNPLVLPQTDRLLFLPHSNAVHPLSRQLQLMACKVSASPSSRELIQAKLPTSSCSLGQPVPKNNMHHISRNGMTFYHKWKVYSYNPPLNTYPPEGISAEDQVNEPCNAASSCFSRYHIKVNSFCNGRGWC